MLFTVWFWGRKIGALGAVSPWVRVIEAENPEAARLRVYETHEHLSSVLVTPHMETQLQVETRGSPARWVPYLAGTKVRHLYEWAS
jgi:hypothetical protein